MAYGNWHALGLAVEVVVLFLFCASHGIVSQKLSNDRISSFPLHSETFLSPPITLGPGEVSNRFYRMDCFPKGHIGIKGVEAEVVDEQGNPVPLTEVYLHHWVITRLFGDTPYPESGVPDAGFNGTIMVAPNAGICQDGSQGQFFGLGSETRLTSHGIPDPYAIVVGDPEAPPKGLKESWLLNVHAIDTRSTLDPKACTECRCDSYGHADLSESKNYTGGLFCCGHGDRCALEPGVSPPGNHTVFLKHTIYWVDWNTHVVPVRIYILDATDDGERQAGNATTTIGCKIEYDVPACNRRQGFQTEPCVHTLRPNLPPFPKGGSVVYAVAHQHAAGIGASLYGEDGGEICTSEPFYGSGASAGDEAGYIVGMSSCYPHPGSVKVRTGEKLEFHSRYSSFGGHTGVMGIFYLLVAD